jgi:hypothetical protein
VVDWVGFILNLKLFLEILMKEDTAMNTITMKSNSNPATVSTGLRVKTNVKAGVGCSCGICTGGP